MRQTAAEPSQGLAGGRVDEELDESLHGATPLHQGEWFDAQTHINVEKVSNEASKAHSRQDEKPNPVGQTT